MSGHLRTGPPAWRMASCHRGAALRRRTTLLTLGTTLALAAQAGAGEPGGDPQLQRVKLLRRARKGVVLLRTEIGVASGTVLVREIGQLAPGSAGTRLKAGLVACAKSSLDSAGNVRAYAFITHVPEQGPDNVKRVELGEAKVVAIHKSADVAILEVPLPAEAAAFPRGPRRLSPGAEVTVAGVIGAAPFGDVGDLRVRRGKIAESWTPMSSPITLTAPTHLNSAGGAVLDGDGKLVGIASFALPDGALGAAVHHHVFDMMLMDVGYQLPADEAAEFVRRKDQPPPFWPVSTEPGGPKGKHVPFGEGVVAVAEARAVLAAGVFVLDGDEALEYLATPLKRGKLHETVIAIDADPAGLNLPFILHKYKQGGWTGRFDGGIGKPYGARLRMYVEWDAAEARAIRSWIDASEARLPRLVQQLSDKRKRLAEQFPDEEEERDEPGVSPDREGPDLTPGVSPDREGPDLTPGEEQGQLAKEIEGLERQVSDLRGLRFRDVREKVREGVIKWEPGQTVRVRAEDLMFNVQEGHPMVHTDWIYTGSSFVKDGVSGKHLFRASLDGVLMAVYRDPSAMFTIPFDAPDDHSYYCVRGSFTPPRGTRCLLIFLPGVSPDREGPDLTPGVSPDREGPDLTPGEENKEKDHNEE